MFINDDELNQFMPFNLFWSSAWDEISIHIFNDSSDHSTEFIISNNSKISGVVFEENDVSKLLLLCLTPIVPM